MRTILLSLALGLALQAQPYGQPYGGRRDPIAQRIEQAERNGRLTHREANRLWGKARDLQFETERVYRSGYGVSYRDRERLERMRDNLERALNREMREHRGNGYRYNDYRSNYPRW